ncbi:lysozyme inhibitor LprI family protein [Methylomonas sp. 11b]|uniref:lysozyme inhibitor LprI family protein n=1 Tax=Methylomonas sp. 11b TaxID=1168169 RepID=UPI00047A999A|nr:hypothetical protein [Methylomonas sp. 11b]
MKKLFFLFINLFFFNANAASFDCQKSTTKIENYICDNSAISELDERMGNIYSNLIRNVDVYTDKTIISNVQKIWIKERDLCSDVECLELAYKKQIEKLISFYNKEELLNITIGNQDEFNKMEVLKVPYADFRLESFNKALVYRDEGKITDCNTLIVVRTARPNASRGYGAYCILEKDGENKPLMVCDDNMIGHFHMQNVSITDDIKKLAEFTYENCFGG